MAIYGQGFPFRHQFGLALYVLVAFIVTGLRYRFPWQYNAAEAEAGAYAILSYISIIVLSALGYLSLIYFQKKKKVKLTYWHPMLAGCLQMLFIPIASELVIYIIKWVQNISGFQMLGQFAFGLINLAVLPLMGIIFVGWAVVSIIERTCTKKQIVSDVN